MAANPQHTPTSEAIAQALEGVDPSRGQRTAFDLARALQGVMARYGVNGGFDRCAGIIKRFALDHGLDFEDLHAEVYLVWDSVLVPEGMDPVAAAAKAAAQEGIPANFFPQKPEKARRLLWVTLGIAHGLSGGGRRTFYLSSRKLGAALQKDAMTANRLLSLLCEEGLLDRVGYSTRTKAQHFKLLHRN